MNDEARMQACMYLRKAGEVLMKELLEVDPEKEPGMRLRLGILVAEIDVCWKHTRDLNV